MVTVPSELVLYRDELLKRANDDEEAASRYAEKAIELRRDAELARAEAAGIERSISAFRSLPIEIASQRSVPRMVASEGDDD